MKNQRKMIECLLLLERMFWRLASLTESFMRTTGLELKRFVLGRRGRNLLSHREIYARNIFRLGKMDGAGWASRGLYIRRVGRLGLTRWLAVGQNRKDV